MGSWACPSASRPCDLRPFRRRGANFRSGQTWYQIGQFAGSDVTYVAVDKQTSRNGTPGWLILLPQLPPQPSSLRVRIWRRLQQLGAVAVKNAAYALPDNSDTLEDFTWLQQEIRDAGGGALLLRATGLGSADGEIEELFRAERAEEYRKLREELEAGMAFLGEKGSSPSDLAEGEELLRVMRERLGRIRERDFFPDRALAETTNRLERAESELRRQSAPVPPETGSSVVTPGQAWVTRRGVYVDRLASAWIIRRFVDPEARFVFVVPGNSLPAGTIPFDMAGAHYGHHGPRCTAETLAQEFAPDDLALRAVAEVVHDLDLKETAFGRSEAAGRKRLLDGICSSTADDLQRISLAAPLFDAIYAGFGVATGATR